MNPRTVKVLTILGFVVPVAAYLALLQHYQVNAIVGDQWDDVQVIRQSYLHFPDWSSLWSQHSDNRILFPNLIVIALAHTVAFNIEVEQYLSALMLFAATTLFIWAHQRRSPGTPLLYYCPFVFLTLTLAQWGNTLWGFQMAWFLVMLALSASIVLLDRPLLSLPVFVAAICVAVVGSFSSLQGLLIWPVGIVLLYHRRRRLSFFMAWLVAMVVTTVVYFYNFSTSTTFDLRLFFLVPTGFVKFFCFALGDIVNVPEAAGQPPNAAVMTFGVVLFVVALLALVKFGVARDERGAAPVGVALIVFGLLFDALITQGRSYEGYVGASQSRYTTYDLLVLGGIYLAALDGGRSQSRARRSVTRACGGWHSDRVIVSLRNAALRVKVQLDRLKPGLILRIALLAMVIQVCVSFHYALVGSRESYQEEVAATAVTRNFNHEPGRVLAYDLYFVKSPGWLRMQAQFLREHHLGPFG